jgi:copper chaperone CopZ
MSVEKAASSIGAVDSALVDLEKKELKIRYAEGLDPVGAVKAAVRDAGFQPM